MNFAIKLLCLTLVIRNSECSEKYCISDVVFVNKDKLSVLKDTDENFTESENGIHNAVNYENWHQMISDNETSDEVELLHNEVPEISSYERGENKFDIFSVKKRVFKKIKK